MWAEQDSAMVAVLDTVVVAQTVGVHTRAELGTPDTVVTGPGMEPEWEGGQDMEPEWEGGQDMEPEWEGGQDMEPEWEGGQGMEAEWEGGQDMVPSAQ